MKKLLFVSLIILIAIGCNDSTHKKETAINTVTKVEGKDHLSSWNEGETKASILNFVKEITDKSSPKFVPVGDRIAAFDNDGTLWTERPLPPQVYFILKTTKQKPNDNVEKNDFSDPKSQSKKDLIKLAIETQTGMNEDNYRKSVGNWFKTAEHPEKKILFKDLTFQPMKELIKLLEENEFTIFIVSGGGRDFMRVFSKDVYGIPEYRIIGSTFNITWNDSLNVIERNPKIELINDHLGKPVGIYNYIGKKPIFIAGNSDGDYYMMKYAATGTHPFLNVLVTHTDAEREYEYNNKIGVDKETQALEMCKKEENWVEVNMKNDWKIIYPFELN